MAAAREVARSPRDPDQRPNRDGPVHAVPDCGCFRPSIAQVEANSRLSGYGSLEGGRPRPPRDHPTAFGYDRQTGTFALQRPGRDRFAIDEDTIPWRADMLVRRFLNLRDLTIEDRRDRRAPDAILAAATVFLKRPDWMPG